MTPDIINVRDWMKQARQATPPIPTTPPTSIRVLRAKLILEEALETIHKGLGISLMMPDGQLMSEISDDYYKQDGVWALCGTPDMVELADGCADLKVVTIGTELACGIDGEPVFNEVMRSNHSKFQDCTWREDGKLVKGPNYSPANIAPILDAQMDSIAGEIIQKLE